MQETPERPYELGTANANSVKIGYIYLKYISENEIRPSKINAVDERGFGYIIEDNECDYWGSERFNSVNGYIIHKELNKKQLVLVRGGDILDEGALVKLLEYFELL